MLCHISGLQSSSPLFYKTAITRGKTIRIFKWAFASWQLKH